MDSYTTQLEEKRLRLLDIFSPISKCELELFPSPSSHYRMRSEFRVWHEGEDLYFYMFDNEANVKIRVDQFQPASTLINQVMAEIVPLLRSNEILRNRLFQVDFLSTTTNEILVTLIYHKQLDQKWIDEARQLKLKLSSILKLKVSEFSEINIVGRAKKQKIEIEKDFVIECLSIGGKKYLYKQVENSFTQPNAVVAQKMIEWTIDVTKDSKGDMLELYCGNGNFSIALAQNFRKILATEVSSSSVEAAQYNIQVNCIENLQIVRMSAEEFSDAMSGGRDYVRMKSIDLKSYDCQTILVDPPRAGLDEKSLSFISQFERIIYISCNPRTLAQNLQVLLETHMIKRTALFDQFPFTHHIESGVVLVKKV